MRIIWELSSDNYLLRIMTGNYLLVYDLAEKLRFIGIPAYPKIIIFSKKYYLDNALYLYYKENK